MLAGNIASHPGTDAIRDTSSAYAAAARPPTEVSAGVSHTDACDAPGNRRCTCDNGATRIRHAAMLIETQYDARHRPLTVAGNYRSAQTLGHFTNSHDDRAVELAPRFIAFLRDTPAEPRNGGRP